MLIFDSAIGISISLEISLGGNAYSPSKGEESKSISFFRNEGLRKLNFMFGPNKPEDNLTMELFDVVRAIKLNNINLYKF